MRKLSSAICGFLGGMLLALSAALDEEIGAEYMIGLGDLAREDAELKAHVVKLKMALREIADNG